MKASDLFAKIDPKASLKHLLELLKVAQRSPALPSRLESDSQLCDLYARPSARTELGAKARLNEARALSVLMSLLLILVACGDGSSEDPDAHRVTATATPTSPATAIPTPEPHPQLLIGSTIGAPGEQVTFDVTADTANFLINETLNDISFDSNTPIAAKFSTKPDCVVNPDIEKIATAFGFFPAGCAGTACTSVRAFVSNGGAGSPPIPDDALLYTCRVNIAPDAIPGEYPLIASAVVFKDFNGASVPGVGSTNGAVVVRTP